MVVAASHPHKLVLLGTAHGHFVHALLPGWVVVLVYAALLAILVAGVWVVSRAAKRMTRPGRIIVAVIALWTIWDAVVVFLDAYRPTGDWGGGIVEAAFIVVYGLVAAVIVLGVDKGVRRFRAAAPV
jgi:hypothetical protein